MTRYVAFLRAVNVGKRIVKMEHLRQLLDAAGFKNVTTYIQSGNVMFASRSNNAAALSEKIEKLLLATYVIARLEKNWASPALPATGQQ
ncbi:DUF1697 domain-containing protein [Chitinophaga polysaccharea]|uniref:DUF1697 domain-containing protein n=1 Tax=Chitinophaga polysaccharea TaxID=1293035 RepID=UPI001157E0EF|nr:DUF1697 domain-containing protein [Chitinophaga polysaccharea]